MIKYIPFSLFILIYSFAHTQCVNNVSTDPNNPTNDNLPDLTSPLDSSLYLNNFNWFTSTGGIYDEYPTDNMLGLPSGATMVNAFGTSGGSYYHYIYDPALHLPPIAQNGWELLSVNLGFFPDGTPLAQHNKTSEYQDIPYFILYHRYKGIVRIFANTAQGISGGMNSTFDAVKVTLSYDIATNVSGIFRLNDGVDQSLDQTTDVKEIASLAKHPNGYRKWFSADFQVTYDPCVCYYPSNLRFDFEFVQQQDIELIGRSVSTDSDLISGSFANDLDFLTNFEYDADDGASSGLVMHQKLGTLVDDYIAKMEQYQTDLAAAQEINEKVERNLAIVKTLDKVIKGAVTAATGVPIDLINDSQLVGKLETYANDLIQKHAAGSDTIKIDVLLAAAQVALGQEAVNFISEKFTKVAEPTKPIAPTATFTEMHFQGKVTQTAVVPGPVLFNPGTYGNAPSSSTLTDVHKYPVYNEAVGVFALLKKPKLRISQTVEDYTCEHTFLDSLTAWSNGCMPNDSIEPTEYDSGLKYELKQNWSKSLKFQLDESLKYYINPALDVKTVDISASIIVDVRNTGASGQGGSWEANNSAFDAVNVESTSINPGDSINLLTADTITFTSIQVPIDALNNFVGGIGISNQYTKIETYPFIYPNYIPNTICKDYYSPDSLVIPDRCSAGEPTNPNNGNPLSDFEYTLDKAQLKLTINITYNTVRTDGDPHEYTYIFTYDIDPSDINVKPYDISPGLATSSANIGQFPKNLNFGNVDFDGSAVDGCKLQGSHYTCQAWDEITITGDILSSNGYTVDIIAGSLIEALPESSISPEITLSIAPILNVSNPTPQVDTSFVSNFCGDLTVNSPEYQANVPTKLQLIGEDQLTDDNQTIDKAPDLIAQLYPNPAGNLVNINMTSTTGEDIHIDLVDITGQVLQSSKLSGRGIEEINDTFTMTTEAYANGYYFVRVRSGSLTQIEKLIIQK